jgi:hypothetical protein
MSDTSHAPGWWSASDGKWYPPQPHSTPRPVPSPQPQPPTLVPPDTAPSQAQAKKPIYKRTWVIVTATIVLVLVIIGTATPSKKKSTKVTAGQPSATTAAPATPTPASGAPATATPVTPTPAQQGNAALDAAAQHVHSIAITVLVKFGTAMGDERQDSVNQLAIAAQNAYGNLDAIKSSDAGVFSNSGDAGYEMFGALNDLKNSMGALVAYTGDPNPATLAQFNRQWQAAASRWNDGVFKVYAGSTLTAPTIPTA